MPLSSAVELPLAEIETVQAEGRYGVSEGAADIFEVTPMSRRKFCDCCVDTELSIASAKALFPRQRAIDFPYF